MYKITKTNSLFSIKTIQEGINPKFRFTYLEEEIRNAKESTIGVTNFFQDILPTLDTKYWIIKDELVTDMTIDEQLIVDNNIINLSFYNKNIKLFAPNYKELVDNGFANTSIVISENTGVVKIFKTLELGIIEGSFYLDFINPSEQLLINGAIAAGFLIETINETRL